MIHRGLMIGLIQKHATQIHKEINQIMDNIINQT